MRQRPEPGVAGMSDNNNNVCVCRHKLLATAVKRYQLDGLNSVQYSLVFIHSDPLYTHIMVDIGKPDIRVER